MKTFVVSLAKKLGYVLAAFIIIAALLVAASRLAVPVLDKHHSEFEAWASQLLETPVTLGKIRVSWYGYQPVLKLNEVTVLNKDSKEPIQQIQQVRIFFSIFKSLWQRTPVLSGIMISGADVNLSQTPQGEITLQGFPSLGGFKNQPYKSEMKFKDAVGWLSMQPRLMVRDIHLRYTQANRQTLSLTLYELSFINNDTQHSILGKAVLHQDIPTAVTAAIEWEGKTFDPAQIKAKIYVYASGVSLTQWLKGQSYHGWQINQGVVSAKVWATWEHNTFQKIQSSLQLYGLNLYSQTDKSTHVINRLSGNLGWKREGNDQIIAGDDIFIDLPAHLWPVTNFYVSLTPDATQALTPKTMTLGYADLNDVQAFLFSSPPLFSDATRQMLNSLKLRGSIQNMSLAFTGAWTDWTHLSLNASFSQLGFASWHTLPGIKNLTGNVTWNGTQGTVKLNSNRAQLQYDGIFTHPINMEQLVGDAQFQQDANKAWILHVNSLQLLNPDLAANMSGTLTLPVSGSPLSDISANFTMQQVNHIHYYLPMRLFDASLITWLKQAFLSGEIKSGNAVLRGPLAAFPFDKNEGSFVISSVVNNIDLHYAPDWPTMRHVNAKLNFSGRQLQIDVESADILNIPITNVHGNIPVLGGEAPAVLQVESSDIQTDFVQALELVHASPLQASLGRMFTGVKMSGPLTLKLALTVPLSDAEKTQVKGTIDMKDADMNLVPWQLDVSHLNGQLQFTENSTTASNIQGQLFNKPLQFSLATIQKGKDSVVQASFANNLSVTDLEHWLKLPVSSMVQGAADVTGKIDFSLQAPIEVSLQSKLVGITVNLPDQYAKKTQEVRDFSADITVPEKQPLRMKISYGKLVNAALILARKKDTFALTAANLSFGNAAVTWPPAEGLYLSGNFPRLDWSQIKSYASSPSKANTTGMKLRGIDISVDTLKLEGHSLDQVHLKVTPTQSNWDVTVSSPDMEGQLQIPMNFSRQSQVSAQFSRLNIRGTQNDTTTASSIDVKSLPSISFVANNVRYNDLPLGQITFKAVPASGGLSIRSLNIVSPRISLQASGDWTSAGNSSTSHLRGNATSARVSDLLSSFGFDVRNFVASTGRLSFSLTWRDAPYAPSIASMSGSASLDLGQGRIVDIGQESGAKMDLGRMLSIFSLQTIPRRLSLDFSDVFQKGYSFDSVRGDFTFRDGNAYTSNLRFDGPVARVGIAGRIGIKNKDLNFTLSVTPYVTSTLPIAATFLGGPWIGAAALAVNAVLGSQVSKAVATYDYDVTGPWSNPSWNPVSGSGK